MTLEYVPHNGRIRIAIKQEGDEGCIVKRDRTARGGRRKMGRRCIRARRVIMVLLIVGMIGTGGHIEPDKPVASTDDKGNPVGVSCMRRRRRHPAFRQKGAQQHRHKGDIEACQTDMFTSAFHRHTTMTGKGEREQDQAGSGGRKAAWKRKRSDSSRIQTW